MKDLSVKIGYEHKTNIYHNVYLHHGERVC